MIYIVAATIVLLLSLSYQEPFYNPEEESARPYTFPDHSKNRIFIESEKILYALVNIPSLKEEERGFLADFLNLIQTIPETTPNAYTIIPNDSSTTFQQLQYVKQMLLQEFSMLDVNNAAYIPVKNSIYYLNWMLKNIFQ